jgi:hypothetical protein
MQGNEIRGFIAAISPQPRITPRLHPGYTLRGLESWVISKTGYPSIRDDMRKSDYSEIIDFPMTILMNISNIIHNIGFTCKGRGLPA